MEDIEGLTEFQKKVVQRSTFRGGRNNYIPWMPSILKGLFAFEEWEYGTCLSESELCRDLFPCTFGQGKVKLVHNCDKNPALPSTGRKLRIGAVFSGGPAPGGHNVLNGIYEFLQRRNADSELLGFLGGPEGILSRKYKTLTDNELADFRNLGGFHLLGTGRLKIETEPQFQAAMETCAALKLDGLVIIGGDDSNTNAALLAEYMKAHGSRTSVIGVPKTIDGDLRNEDIETSFGFDTASKVYSAQVSNICYDAISSLKSYHFIRLMGRDASHITLEIALKTHPNLVFIAEEVAASNKDGKPTTLADLVTLITDMVVERAAQGRHYGVILIPEGLISFVPDMKRLIEELNDILAAHPEMSNNIRLFEPSQLSEASQQVYSSLPDFIVRQLMGERDPHGNVVVSAIETDLLLAHMAQAKLTKLAEEGKYDGKFSFVNHFFGYEARCAFPSKFDCDYCQTLGATAAALIEGGKTGMIATVKNLTEPATAWEVGGTPIVSLMHIEKRHGKNKPVIRKKLVDLNDAPFLTLQKLRESWRVEDNYRAPGPVQFEGEGKEVRHFTLYLEAERRRRTQNKSSLAK